VQATGYTYLVLLASSTHLAPPLRCCAYPVIVNSSTLWLCPMLLNFAA
jgi:hypothetical protein